jgi:hypothetical protein
MTAFRFPTQYLACIVLGTSLAFSGCMSRLQMTLPEAKVVEVPENIKNWVLLDRSFHRKKGEPAPRLLRDEEIRNRYEQAAIQGIEGFIKYFENDCVSFSVTPVHLQLAKRKSEEGPLAQNSVQWICEEFSADALVELSFLEILWDTTTIRELSGRNQYHYFTYLDLSCRYQWRIYTADYQLLDQFEGRFRDQWQASGTSEQGAIRKLPAKAGIAADLFPAMGREYAASLCPGSFEAERKFYKRKTGPNHAIAEAMLQAGKLAEEGRWQEAAKLWRPIAENPQLGKVAGKAAYNLALASELRGDLPNTRRWLLQAYERHRIGAAKAYLDIVYERLGLSASP